jgi:hypothetical protein
MRRFGNSHIRRMKSRAPQRLLTVIGKFAADTALRKFICDGARKELEASAGVAVRRPDERTAADDASTHRGTVT